MALDPNTWTQKTTEAVNAALEAARQRNNPEVTPDHLLTALLGQEEGKQARTANCRVISLRQHHLLWTAYCRSCTPFCHTTSAAPSMCTPRLPRLLVSGFW